MDRKCLECCCDSVRSRHCHTVYIREWSKNIENESIEKPHLSNVRLVLKPPDISVLIISRDDEYDDENSNILLRAIILKQECA